MSKSKDSRSSSAMSFPMTLLLLIAIAGLVIGIVLLVKESKNAAAELPKIEMTVGQQRTLETTLTGEITYAVVDDSIAFINDEKLITALSVGSTTISAQNEAGEQQTFQLTVSANGGISVADPAELGVATTTTTTETTVTTTTTTTVSLAKGAVAKIELSYTEVTVKPKEKAKYASVRMYDTEGVVVTGDKKGEKAEEKWTTSDATIATVDNAGNITGVAPGTCKVRVTSVSSPSVFCEITVTVPGATTVTTVAGDTTTTTTVAGQTTAAAATSAPAAAGSAKIEQKNGITYVNGIMIANKSYPLPQDYNPGDDATALAALEKMKAAAKAEGYTIASVSGFRSYSTQEYLYNSYCTRDGKEAADTYSARPGHSEHQTGLAFDINDASDAFTSTPEAAWLAANCWKYGFIIRYPEGKESITGYKYESWHVRYLGDTIAKSVHDSGLTLEEYLGIDSKYAS